MKFSKYFGLGLTQAELDFVDIELDGDMRLFIDPYALRGRIDPLSVACANDVRVFFQTLLDAMRDGEEEGIRELLGSLHEPNETRLGYSMNEARGSGIGRGLADRLHASLIKSRAFQTGFIKDISDAELLVEGIGPDKISDLTTNILRHHLVRYTQSQCVLHKVKTISVPSGPLWDGSQLEWREEYVELPVADNNKILLVPKSIVRWQGELDPREYFDHYVIHFLRQRELSNAASGLGRLIRGQRRITKKELKQKYGNGSKDFLLTFSEHNPEVLEQYKSDKGLAAPLTARELENDFDPVAFAKVLSLRLKTIPAGPDDATTYHRFILGVLSFLFYPNLLHPKIEAEINEGRKRIDVLYENGARSGIFERFTPTLHRPSMFISVECKNYTREVGNPEIDQLIGRFANHRGHLGFLLCRTVEDKELLLSRCRDTAAAGLGYILPLDDENLLAILRHVENQDYSAVDGHLSELLRQVVS